MMAQRRTMHTGGGIEFSDHRHYVAGDDFRYLDWNLFARHDELLLKRFQEEEDLHVYLLVDCSRSMAVGDPSKFDLARQVAAALAYIALSDLDRVSVFGFSGETPQHFPLTRGKSRILSVMQFLEQLSADGVQTNLTALTKDFVMRAPRRGLVTVLSDFYDPNGYQESLDLLRHHKFDPHVVQFFHHSEADPGFVGDVELTDVETGEARNMTVTESHLDRYKRAFEAFVKGLQEYCSRYGLGCTITDSSSTFDDLVLGMMNIRSAS